MRNSAYSHTEKNYDISISTRRGFLLCFSKQNVQLYIKKRKHNFLFWPKCQNSLKPKYFTAACEIFKTKSSTYQKKKSKTTTTIKIFWLAQKAALKSPFSTGSHTSTCQHLQLPILRSLTSFSALKRQQPDGQNRISLPAGQGMAGPAPSQPTQSSRLGANAACHGPGGPASRNLGENME